MKIGNHITWSKYKRFFAFGCSFTDYKWPMWPEIISKFIPEYYNFGCSGCDNRTIFLRINEADCLYKFNENDLVIVMWTNIWRDTIFDPNKNWYLKRVPDKDLNFKPINFIFRDFCFFKSISNLLENKQIDYDFLSISGYDYDLFLNYHCFNVSEEELKDIKKLTNLFKDPLQSFKPSMFESVYDFNWDIKNYKFSVFLNSEEKLIVDNHPTPIMSLDYLKKIYFLNNFDITENFVNTYTEKIVGKCIKERIQPRNEFETILERHPLITNYD